MPLVNLTVRGPKTAEFKNKVLDAIQAALVDAGAHENDQFHRIYELEPENFRFHATFPDVKTARTDDFVLADIFLGTGRSVRLKKQILAGIAARLSATGFDPENLMVVFHDVPWENWSPAGGRVPHA
jgi:phenylpyruvate tautomerase PptA (4-oxalocrotonate tautomerase family)